nr:reverse transcriptase domain-containing protein [Candidatus Protofrankia datiscae]
MLSSPPTEEDIKDAVLLTDPHSSPEPDGFSCTFYQTVWDIKKNSLIAAVLYFFYGGIIPRSINARAIAFIPKKGSPATFSDFRPISLCNFSYKVITKILSNRLSRLLPIIISKEQGAFVKDRLISDNITIVHELVREIDRHTYGGNIIFKLDMMKAYDRLEWDFLF